MEMKLIDVSKHNGVIDWKKVKADGIEGVIIRAGYGKLASQKDSCFESYYSGAKAAGLHIGTYWYSYATDPETAVTEAEVFLSAIKEKPFDLPVYLDIEDTNQLKLSKEVCTAIATAFCEKLENAGYFCGVYSFDSFFLSHLDSSIGKRFSIWAARVENIKPSCAKDYQMWQYSWKGRVAGINGDVDLDIAYRDFPAIITEKGFNNCAKDTKKKNLKAWKNNISAEDADKLKESLLSLGMSVSVIDAE